MSTDPSELAKIYQDLHRHPELSHAETRTAQIAADHLLAAGFEVTTGVGKTGVVGVLERGEGPTVYLRADMDALPVLEQTGLPYASRATGMKDGKQVPVMHACGHDVHTTVLIGATARLAAASDWSGRLVAIFQPAEETGAGAKSMIADGLHERFGTPDVVLGQHVAPMPAGMIGLHSGPSYAAADSIRITLFGRGGHGSRPETTVDPILMAAALVQRLQGIVAREVAASDVAVVSVGALHAGTTAENIIPDEAELRLTVRTFDPKVRERVLAAIERIARAESTASGAEREPEIDYYDSFPAVVNDATAIERVAGAFNGEMPQVAVMDPGVISGSEDVGLLAGDSGAPTAYWILGGADPALFAQAKSVEDFMRIVATLPSNHSSKFAPVIEPTLSIGVTALVTAARAWLSR